MTLQSAELAKVRKNATQGQQQSLIERQAITAWNLMGGRIEWTALDTIAAVLDVDDVDLMVRGLLQIREWTDAAREH